MKEEIKAYNSVLDLIGNTPLIKLNKVSADLPGNFYAKVEAFNPGHSTKDRIALYIIEEAEKRGILKPGDTIIETTSGNTGFSLAMVSIIKGSNCILAVSSKSSKDKIDMSHNGIEILFERESSMPFKPWFSVASTRLTPSVSINAPLEFIQEEAFVETSGRLTTLTLGLNYKLSDNWLLNLGTSYTPIDVQRPQMSGGNDNFWNIKIGLTFLPN